MLTDRHQTDRLKLLLGERASLPYGNDPVYYFTEVHCTCRKGNPYLLLFER